MLIPNHNKNNTPVPETVLQYKPAELELEQNVPTMLRFDSRVSQCLYQHCCQAILWELLNTAAA